MDGEKNSSMTANIIDLIAGVWIFFTPFFFGAAGTAFATGAYVIGIVIAAIALVRLMSAESTGWLDWISTLAGAWLILSPLFMTNLTRGEIWNNVIVGLIIVAASLWDVSAMSHMRPQIKAG